MRSVQESTLTGRVRARPSWFGKQILQVEVVTTSFSSCPPPPGRDAQAWKAKMRAQGDQAFSWRDATWADWQTIGRADLVPPGSIEPSRPWPHRSNAIGA